MGEVVITVRDHPRRGHARAAVEEAVVQILRAFGQRGERHVERRRILPAHRGRGLAVVVADARLDLPQETAVEILLAVEPRSEEHTSELQSLMRISYAVFCLQKKNTQQQKSHN